MAGPGAQRLLRRPKGVAPAGRADHGEMHEVDTGGGERGGIRHMRRREPHDALAGAREPSERRQQQLQLADAVLPPKDLGERAAGPSAARQLVVERVVAGGDGLPQRRQRSTAPDGMLRENGIEGDVGRTHG